MIQLKKMVFNSFQVNTYLLFDETGECVIIDPANQDDIENKALTAQIREHKLKPVRILNTHCHVDHVLGVHFLMAEYDIPFHAHEEEETILKNAPLMGDLFGFSVEPFDELDSHITHREKIRFGNSELTALHVPGHSRGSLAFYAEQDAFAITGDALFAAGIGRPDLPGGDYDTLIESINNNLFTLPHETTIWPGHGESSTIGKEILQNPFFQ